MCAFEWGEHGHNDVPQLLGKRVLHLSVERIMSASTFFVCVFRLFNFSEVV